MIWADQPGTREELTNAEHLRLEAYVSIHDPLHCGSVCVDVSFHLAFEVQVEVGVIEDPLEELEEESLEVAFETLVELFGGHVTVGVGGQIDSDS